MNAGFTEEEWRRLDSLFQQAIDLPLAEQQAFVDAATADDPELRRHLLEMLAQDGDAAARIAGSIAGLAQFAVTGGTWTGRRVGSYRIIREIGRGGMGIVFEAVRDDAEYRKTVALKILPAWRDQAGLRERFLNERQILSGLEHPNIARFLEGGTEDGVPYFVMEYVEGVSLAEWRRTRNPGLRQVLDLFRQVCAAVHCAHENLVVHRDLKPANILVNREDVPKLLDFGIAKLLAPLPGQNGSTTELRHWTPDYTSPEQVRGGAITTRTDVYSLGLVLYELLCGEHAQVADSSSPLALDRSVCEIDPPPPSARAAARGDVSLARQLRGDLDTIVAKAIAKDPPRRYNSVAALSADLDCYLEGRPVSARPATLFYRAGKLVRRRRFTFAAAALIAATAIAGVAATVHQARRAERRFEQVRSLATAFVFDVHDRIQYLPGATEARKVIVATGLRYLESLREDAASDKSLALELGQAYLRIGDVQGHPLYSSLHDTEGALASYGSARTLLAPLAAKGDPQAQLALGEVELRFGLIAYQRGQGSAAEASFQRARSFVRSVLAKQPDNFDALMLAGDVSAQLARDATERRRPDVARSEAEGAVEIARRLSAIRPGSIESLDYLSSAESSLGSADRASGRLVEAAASYRESAEAREQLVHKQPQNSSYLRELMLAYAHVGDTLGPAKGGGLGDIDAAAQAYDRVVEIAQQMVKQDPADRTARSDLANAQARAGDVLITQPAHARDALALLQASERGFADILKEDPGNERDRFVLLFAQRRSGEALETLGRDAEAARKLVAARTLARTFEGTRDQAGGRVAFALATIALARIKAHAGDPTALSLANAAAEAVSSVSLRASGTPWSEAAAYASMGHLFLQLGQKDKATFWLRKSLADWSTLKVPAPIESQRLAELNAVAATLAKAQNNLAAAPLP